LHSLRTYFTNFLGYQESLNYTKNTMKSLNWYRFDIGFSKYLIVPFLAKRHRKWTQVENLGLLATPFDQAVRAFAQVDARFLTFGRNLSQRKLSDVH